MLVTLAGYVALVVIVGRLLAYLSKYVKSPIKVKFLGDWALVTGATDGIGKSSILLNLWGAFAMIIFCIATTISSKILDLFELTPLETNFLCRQRLLLGPCQEGHEHRAGQPQQGQA